MARKSSVWFGSLMAKARKRAANEEAKSYENDKNDKLWFVKKQQKGEW
jgi:hypothetical protein